MKFTAFITTLTAITASVASAGDFVNGQPNVNGQPIVSVPDSGSSLMLLGIAAAGLMLLAKKKFRR